ncbi:MAG: chromate resistance protein [Alphaproteobacteria bacterium]|nr:chromate resistance protein [Alphaproteobacteria bacterium]
MAVPISVSDLRSRLATGHPLQLIDVRRRQFHAAAPRIVAGATWRDPGQTDSWSGSLDRDRDVVVYCVHGLQVGRSVADALERQGLRARFLEGGIAAWEDAGGATTAKRVEGVRWITRARPKIDRIACPWLIARFIDPRPEFLYVAPDRVLAEAEQHAAIPYDVPDVDLSHVGPLCSFDAFLRIYRLEDPALARLATIVRGADTNELHLSPQSPGLLALSLGLSHDFPDDHEMLRHGMVMYDALYSWCRSLTGETHGWNPKP